MAQSGGDPELLRLISIVRTLLNPQLKDLLRYQNLPVSGVKATLQARVISHLTDLSFIPDRRQYDRFKGYIYSRSGHGPPTASTQLAPQSGYQQHTAVPPPLPPPPTSRPPAFPGAMGPSSIGRLSFKESPFYTILEPLTTVGECKVREHTRDHLELKVNLGPDVATRLQNDPNLRVMVYCAADTGITQYSRCDIAFPYQVELKVNLDEIKTNLRGLKNKPGTTRPADITSFIRKKPGYTNHVMLTYALTQKKFFAVVNLVQRHSVDELVRKLQIRKTITSEQVIREMKSKAEDSDIVATSTVMSLKCPLSTLRINVPCRTSLCTHNQCFDASSFLQLQEQAPTWMCPVCNKSTSYEALQVDQYVANILASTPSSVEQVTIEPNGEWSRPDEKSKSRDSSDSLDNDLVEISNGYGRSSLKQEAAPLRFNFGSTTPSQSREQSSVSSATRPSSNKRKASEVIDLTLSDEEEAPQPAPRRPFLQPNGHARYQPYQPGQSFNPSSSSSPLPNAYYFDS